MRRVAHFNEFSYPDRLFCTGDDLGSVERLRSPLLLARDVTVDGWLKGGIDAGSYATALFDASETEMFMRSTYQLSKGHKVFRRPSTVDRADRVL